MLIIIEIDLKKASKAFATKFSCGSSVTGEDEIVIQGDVCDEVAEYIPEHWNDVSPQHCIIMTTSYCGHQTQII